MRPNDTTNEIPCGYCQCGCGQKTRLAPSNHKQNGWIKGEPLRYINGHNGTKPVPPAPIKLCECGCGLRAPIAKYTDKKRGWSKGQPKRFIDEHYGRVPAEKHFWDRVDKRAPNECWPWQGSTGSNGYGHLRVKRKMVVASRFSYELHFGPIPGGLLVCHKCDNPPCCNPNHLFLGTVRDNALDMAAKGRNKFQRAYGSKHSQAKLVESQVVEIRQRHTLGESTASLARAFGISVRSIRNIASRFTWRHVE